MTLSDSVSFYKGTFLKKIAYNQQQGSFSASLLEGT